MGKTRAFSKQGYAPVMRLRQNTVAKCFVADLTGADPSSALNSMKEQTEGAHWYKVAIDAWTRLSSRPDLEKLAKPYISKWPREGLSLIVPAVPLEMFGEDGIVSLKVEKRLLRPDKALLKKFASLWQQPSSRLAEFCEEYGSLFFPRLYPLDPVVLVTAASWRYCAFRRLCQAIQEIDNRSSVRLAIETAMHDLWNEYPESHPYTLHERLVLLGPKLRGAPEDVLFKELLDSYGDEIEKALFWKRIAEDFAKDQVEDLLQLVARLEVFGLRVQPTCLLGAIWAYELEIRFGTEPPPLCPICKARFLTVDGELTSTRLRPNARTCGDSRCRNKYSHPKRFPQHMRTSG